MRLRHPGGLAPMSMNFFAFFLGAGQPGYNQTPPSRDSSRARLDRVEIDSRRWVAKVS